MKKIILGTITLYQIISATLLKQLLGVRSFCRFTPSCSQYTKQMIEKYGIIRGSYLGIQRILHCHPFSKGNYLSHKYYARLRSK